MNKALETATAGGVRSVNGEDSCRKHEKGRRQVTGAYIPSMQQPPMRKSTRLPEKEAWLEQHSVTLPPAGDADYGRSAILDLYSSLSNDFPTEISLPEHKHE